MSTEKFLFTNNWFEASAKGSWDQLIPKINPTRILEIGSYEGASACYLIQHFSSIKPVEIHCIDSWQGGIEHKEGGSIVSNMSEVEKRFRHNIEIAEKAAEFKPNIHIHKGFSDIVLAQLLSNGKLGYFDFVYVDGSHQAPDVLCDAVLAFRLLRNYGVMAFDDYIWQETLPYGTDLLRCPKPAIDAFTNLYCRKVKIIPSLLYQLYIQKVSD